MVVQQQLAALTLDESTRAAISEESSPAVVSVTIDIAPELAGQAEKDLLMFLIARDQNQPTPPVAVKRVRVGDFPVTIKISDADAMVPGRNIKTTKNLELVVRISKTGEPFAADGDLYGETLDVSGARASQQAQIRIDRVVGQD
jgi:cytochrome c-type biogenesis protein CcmH